MSPEFVIKILQVGFSGFVFLMALFSYNLIRKEQERPGGPRADMFKELKDFRRWMLFVSLLVLLSPLCELLGKTYFSSKSVTIEGSTVCLLRNTSLSRTSAVLVPGTKGITIKLLSTQVGIQGGSPRGAAVSIAQDGKAQERFFRENGVETTLFDGISYQVEVTNVKENTAEVSICRSL